MKERNLTCIVCPRGCALTVKFDGSGKIEDVCGYVCKRGLEYAQTECTHPKRTVTSTVKCECGKVLPVKTSAPIPKELVFDVMREINSAVVKKGSSIGDVVIANVLDTGADIIITANKN